jgi:hypothetical protein
MGGQAAIRGFTYQTIVSVIKSLTNDDWTHVQVEPDTENDRVDILWENKDQKGLCQKVKSSVNNFGCVYERTEDDLKLCAILVM